MHDLGLMISGEAAFRTHKNIYNFFITNVNAKLRGEIETSFMQVFKFENDCFVTRANIALYAVAESLNLRFHVF